MKPMEKYLLDGNCFDFMARNSEDLRAIFTARASSLIEIIGTHVEVDEMRRAERDRPEYATELLNIRNSLSIRTVPASGFVFEISKIHEATLFGWDEIDDFVKMTNDNPRHAEDALLVRTALKENAVLVTEEKSRLPRIARERQVKVVNTSELANICRKLAKLR